MTKYRLLKKKLKKNKVKKREKAIEKGYNAAQGVTKYKVAAVFAKVSNVDG